MAAANGDANDVGDEMASKVPPGTVMPPRNIREIIEKTAEFVARRGPEFEERIKQKQGNANTTMAFIYADDAYNPYYRWRLDEIRAGRGANTAASKGDGQVSFQGREERKGPEKPPEFAFSARMPNISAQDLDVVRLTALFVAKNGRNWMTSLSQREASNFQFDFLRPQHSMYQFFSRLVDQYTELLDGGNIDGGKPQRERVAQLEANVENRFAVLDKAKKRAEWVKYEEAQKVAKEEGEEKERLEYAQIDWHDFVVVEVVTFDESDENANLPAPPTLNDLQSASLEQKAAMSIDPSRRLEEAMPGVDDFAIPMHRPQQNPAGPSLPPKPPASAPYNQTQPAPVWQPSPVQAQNAYYPPPASGEPNRLAAMQADRERARIAQEGAKSANEPMKIKRDYVPAAAARKQVQNTSICPNCKQAIPNDEMQRHLQIELLDPQWREQSRKAQQRSATTNLSTVEVVSNLKRLASQRTDVFDPVTGHALTPEEQERRKRAELQSYDGVSTMPNPHAIAGMGNLPKMPGQEGANDVDVNEQIRQLQLKYKP